MIVDINDNTIEFYDDIDDFPAILNNRAHIYAVQKNGIGSTIDDVNKFFSKLDYYLAEGKTNEAIAIRKNMQQTFYNNMEGINHDDLVLACFVKSINNELPTGFMDSDISKTSKKLLSTGITRKYVDELIRTLKKKLTIN